MDDPPGGKIKNAVGAKARWRIYNLYVNEYINLYNEWAHFHVNQYRVHDNQNPARDFRYNVIGFHRFLIVFGADATILPFARTGCVPLLGHKAACRCLAVGKYMISELGLHAILVTLPILRQSCPVRAARTAVCPTGLQLAAVDCWTVMGDWAQLRPLI